MKNWFLPCILAVTTSLPLMGNAETESEYELEIVGFVDEARFEMVRDLYLRYLAGPIPVKPNVGAASAVIFYMGPDIVEGGVFMPPPGTFIAPQQLEALSEMEFTDGKCRVQNLSFGFGESRIVMLVDDTENPPPPELQGCVLLAFALALGADSLGLGENSVPELISIIDEMRAN